MAAIVVASSAMLLVGCHRENRYFQPPPGSDSAPSQQRMSPLVGGEIAPGFREQQRKMYEENAYHVSEGKRLFTWFNCVGCHAHGGGDSGPALMDDEWLYGGEIDEIFLSIMQGRPNGMPAFAGKIPEQQVWQLAGYVRTMGGFGTKEARPGRDDHMQKPSEQAREQHPIRGQPGNMDR
jgi:cytochrome c oxidase cbb3-type subunit 3